MYELLLAFLQQFKCSKIGMFSINSQIIHISCRYGIPIGDAQKTYLQFALHNKHDTLY